MKVFTEEQRFKRWYLLVLVALPVFGILIPFMLKKEDAPLIGSDTYWGLIITVSTFLITLIFILSIKLNTKIDEQGIFYQFFPIHFGQKFISWNEIDKSYLKKYNSITDFGGYGYRIRPFGKMKGKSINVGGNYGIQLELKNGKKLLIGTQKENDVKQILATYKMKLNEK